MKQEPVCPHHRDELVLHLVPQGAIFALHMTRSYTFRAFLGILGAVALLLMVNTASAQEPSARPPGIASPAPLRLWQWERSIGLSLSTLPRVIVEEELNQSPALDLRSRLGLPWGFSADARLLIQVLTNHLEFGGSWSFAIGRFAVSLGDNSAWWFGFLTIDGFDNSANGWLNYPNISLGYDFGRFRVVLRAEMLLVLSFRSYAGDYLLSSDKNGFGGFSSSVTIEQPFWKNTHVLIGFKASYLKYFYQSWFTYETFNRYLFIPELSFGFIL